MIKKEVLDVIESRLSGLERQAHALLDERRTVSGRIRTIEHKLALMRRAAANYA